MNSSALPLMSTSPSYPPTHPGAAPTGSGPVGVAMASPWKHAAASYVSPYGYARVPPREQALNHCPSSAVTSPPDGSTGPPPMAPQRRLPSHLQYAYASHQSIVVDRAIARGVVDPVARPERRVPCAVGDLRACIRRVFEKLSVRRDRHFGRVDTVRRGGVAGDGHLNHAARARRVVRFDHGVGAVPGIRRAACVARGP